MPIGTRSKGLTCYVELPIGGERALKRNLRIKVPNNRMSGNGHDNTVIENTTTSTSNTKEKPDDQAPKDDQHREILHNAPNPSQEQHNTYTHQDSHRGESNVQDNCERQQHAKSQLEDLGNIETHEIGGTTPKSGDTVRESAISGKKNDTIELGDNTEGISHKNNSEIPSLSLHIEETAEVSAVLNDQKFKKGRS